MNSSLNIILFGETGVGKSSVINLIAGSEIAPTSADSQPCTMSFHSYTFSVCNRNITIWDTAGLEQPGMDMDGHSYLPAIEQAGDLIRQLRSKGGVDLLLFCIRGTRITPTTRSNYRLFYEVLCGSKVPIALVITHLEREDDLEAGWEKRQKELQEHDIKVASHACVTGLPNHKKYQESRANISKLLEGITSEGRFTMPPEGWFIEFWRSFRALSSLKRMSKRQDIVKVLTKRCGLDQKIAEELVDKLEGMNLD